ncbi:type II toxin-antitoxin system HipA family toxin [Aliidiomarina soli]|uniref:Serine/threonine protein kinase n=1 Tax=Aliidiomarina soli TaxID=1928574 RepID=A0A432WDZ0_9GAMM|nr:type II toxin-antitoxin system HipA family toxin [Aliidiomarina soli]RUO31089.1 serine/threonine protein kinase [Aliidiomarina soli]
MGRRSHTDMLYCAMNGILVGRLLRRHGRLSFQYESEWISRKGSRAISLSIPLQSQEIMTDAVHAYFENLLPDSDVVRKHIVDKLGATSNSPFDLLAQIGGDCIGALSLTKEPVTDSILPTVNVSKLRDYEVAQHIRHTRQENMLGLQADDDFRISLAGAQEKTALTLWDGDWCKPHGATPTTHIFKPPIMHHPQMALDMSNSVENEWFCLRFLGRLGLPVTRADIAKFEDQTVLVVERFDRVVQPEQNRIVRLPQEDMCQALGVVSGSKYEEFGGPGSLDIMKVLSGSLTPHEDKLTFFKSQIAFWLLAAIDGHAKNFSIHLQSNGYRLCPLYDVLSAYPYFGQGNIQRQKIKMAMKVHSKNTHYRWHEIMGRHWLAHGRYLGLSTEYIEEAIRSIVSNTESALACTLNDAPNDGARQVGELIQGHILRQVERLRATLN